ncbi:N-6 DNA methylase [Methylobacterium sp. 22177]|uniref:N-6 DNA methylase n=1 Tax=Methylobacterium sp. 22177 TaxID=3453885 RepID=UPI003F865BCF
MLQDIISRLCRRDQGRPEVETQADIRQLILEAPFELHEGDLKIVSLEAPIAGGRRIDIEVGSTVIEVKRDLRRGRVREEAIDQLSGYVATRAAETGLRYVGVLTDGAEWRCYNLVGSTLEQVSEHAVTGDADSLGKLIFWLEGVLATATNIAPTSREIEARLGARSSAYALDRATVAALYEHNKDLPTVKLKRELWSRLLASALGNHFKNDDALFIEHTLLVNTAEVIAHAVLGLKVTELNPASLLSGEKFAESSVYGVVEADFFDWVIEVDSGDQFIKTLARRLSRFDWSAVREDVLKVLYESVISPDTRKKLGEYYTPDWLAEAIVEEAVSDPLSQKVLDPSCGSGTFLFHCVRKFLDASALAGADLASALNGLTRHVMGMDLHPVAVLFARVTYLLAIGRDRLTNSARGAIHIPVFLGDSLQWREQQLDLWTAGELVIHADDGRELVGSELRFPDELLEDAELFDQLVDELATKASSSRPGRAAPSLAAVFSRLAIPKRCQATINDTFATMCRLHNEGRDHIWGYYVRNMARPMWLAREANRVDLLIGNPPWVAYRNMSRDMQVTFKEMSERRNLWAGKELATAQDLSALFVVRATELYLKKGGHLAMVLPNAAVDREQFAGFRCGTYSGRSGNLSLAFEGSWDLRRIRPHFFPRGASVVFARRADHPGALPQAATIWSGRLPRANCSWSAAREAIERSVGDLRRLDEAVSSPFAERFSQGATFNPRVLFIVHRREAGPLGLQAGRVAVESSRSANEKLPYRELPPVRGVIESEFVRPVYSGENLLPYRVLSPLQAVIPCSADRSLSPREIDFHSGLRTWWAQCEKIWEGNRAEATRLSLMEQLNYQSKLTRQLPIAPFRVIYNASGMHLAAAKLRDNRALVSKSLYWAAFRSEDEADYLCAILNSSATTELLRPLMSYGKDERHVDKNLWQLAIADYDPENPTHQELVTLSRRIGPLIEGIEIGEARHFPIIRRKVRETIEGSPEGARITQLVSALITRTDGN